MIDRGGAPRQAENSLRQFHDGGFFGVSKVYRPGEVLRSVHKGNKALHHVIHIAEAAGLSTVAIDRQRPVLQRLDDKIAYDPAVIDVHVGAVGVEDPGHLDIDLVLTVIIEAEGLGAALTFVVARSQSDGIDVSPIRLRLRMDLGVAIYLAGGGLEHPGLDPLGQTQYVDGPHDRGFDSLDGIVLIMNRAGGAGQVIDLVNLEENGVDKVVPDELKVGLAPQILDVPLVAGKKIVQAKHVVPLPDNLAAKVRT